MTPYTSFLKHITRRTLLKMAAAGVCTYPLWGRKLAYALLSASTNRKDVIKNDAPEALWKWSKEVYYSRRLSRDTVQCMTCPNRCVLPPNARSRCRSHVNKDGRLYTLVYGNPCAVHVDPVEKKPLYHFLPGTGTYSIATTGCSFHCLNCQNWQISQARPEEVRHEELFPPAVVDRAIETGCRSIAYTYSEATTFYEYMVDTAAIARKRGIRNIWVTNGYINPAPLDRLADVIDAANVDLKSFSEETYARLNAGRLAPVLRTLETLVNRGVWLEITLLIVPTYTDTLETVTRVCRWIRDHLGPGYPLHISRFYPQYKLTRLPPASIAFLHRTRETALDMGLHHVYLGNVPPSEADHTYCPACGKKVIDRRGYRIHAVSVVDGACATCGAVIPGAWE